MAEERDPSQALSRGERLFYNVGYCAVFFSMGLIFTWRSRIWRFLPFVPLAVTFPIFYLWGVVTFRRRGLHFRTERMWINDAMWPRFLSVLTGAGVGFFYLRFLA